MQMLPCRATVRDLQEENSVHARSREDPSTTTIVYAMQCIHMFFFLKRVQKVGAQELFMSLLVSVYCKNISSSIMHCMQET